MKTLYFACFVVAGFSMAGCRAPDQGKLDGLAASLLSTRDDLDGVKARLEREGFECGSKSSAHRVHCARRSGSLIHTCAENVTLMVDPMRNKVTGTAVGKVACAGF